MGTTQRIKDETDVAYTCNHCSSSCLLRRHTFFLSCLLWGLSRVILIDNLWCLRRNWGKRAPCPQSMWCFHQERHCEFSGGGVPPDVFKLEISFPIRPACAQSKMYLYRRTQWTTVKSECHPVCSEDSEVLTKLRVPSIGTGITLLLS